MRKPHAFITGIAGFAGSYLAEELLEAGYNVSGSILDNESTSNLASIEDRLSLETVDILDPGNCQAAVSKLKPDYIFHLAAIASVGRSFEQESLTFSVNFHGTLNMLEAARQLRRLEKFVYVSSADCYGIFSPKSKTLNEEQPLNPISPYGISKAASEQAARYYCRHHYLPAVVSRSFNHSGPRQSTSFVIPTFARQIAEIENGRQEPVILVGDLRARRDFSDARDIVRGYRLLAERGVAGEVYQLCSGKAVAIRTVLNRLLALSTRDIRIEVDRSKLRKSDLPVLRGSNRKAAQSVGFKLRYTLRQTLHDTLEYWRDQVSAAD
ncbi:MAG: GDP-mannose 4,6-dehydratase [Candidatus Zixiibacteriota bacterium]|nr:MAG: GDP-mannose 4,6-dehydratase [candidate division Zixibacteria bacterium]